MLKTSFEVATASLQGTADNQITSDERYNRALDLHEAGLFASVAEAQSYLDLLARCQRGEQLSAETQRFVDESQAIEKQLERFRETRRVAVDRQAKRAQAQARRARLDHMLSVERARLAAVPADPYQAAYLDYQRYLGEGAYMASIYMEPALGAVRAEAYRKLLKDVVIPDLEEQLRLADAEAKKLAASA